MNENKFWLGVNGILATVVVAFLGLLALTMPGCDKREKDARLQCVEVLKSGAECKALFP